MSTSGSKNPALPPRPRPVSYSASSTTSKPFQSTATDEDAGPPFSQENKNRYSSSSEEYALETSEDSERFARPQGASKSSQYTPTNSNTNSASKPGLSSFKEKMKSKASEAAKVTAEWRAKAAEKSTELQAKAKVVVGEWETKARERMNSHQSSTASKSASSETVTSSIFGVLLPEAVERSRVGTVKNITYPEEVVRNLPAVAYRCVEYLEAVGLDEVGIYRVSGSTTEVGNLRNLFNTGADVELVGEQIDPNAVASLFKAWLRELPEPILTNTLAPQFSRIFPSTLETAPIQHIPQVREMLSRVPQPYYSLLQLLFTHLSRVASKEDVNKMGISNLQVIFCPTLGMTSTLFAALVGGAGELFGSGEWEDVSIMTVEEIGSDQPNRTSMRVTGSPPVVNLMDDLMGNTELVGEVMVPVPIGSHPPPKPPKRIDSYYVAG